jgi:hypothetical protein
MVLRSGSRHPVFAGVSVFWGRLEGRGSERGVHTPALRFINYVNSGMAERNRTTKLGKLRIPEPRKGRPRPVRGSDADQEKRETVQSP